MARAHTLAISELPLAPPLLFHLLELHRCVNDNCLSGEAFIRHAQCRCEKLVEQQWREHTPLPTTLLHVEHIRALATIQRHAYPHAVMELADDGEHSRWNAKASQDSSQESMIDGVSQALERSIKHMNSGVSFLASSCRRRTTNIISIIERWGLNATCASGRMSSLSQ